MKIGVNCGHTVSGTIGSGATGYLNESDETRAVGYALMKKLKSCGVDVVDCTNDYATSTSENLKNIVDIANSHNLDIFISIHFNAGGGQGVECWTYAGRNVEEARKINHNIALLGFKNRGIKDGSHLYVVRNTKAKSILVECCFVDTRTDAETYTTVGAERIANAISQALINNTDIKEIENVPKTVYSLDNVHIQVIDPWNFKILSVDNEKKSININNYANAGYFAVERSGATIPVGNLVIEGNIITDAKNQADWLSSARKQQTTLVVHNDNSIEFVKTDDMMTVPAVKYAISGVPIIRNGRKVSLDAVKAEGYTGGELYDTWHGFLGIRNNRLVYVASKCDYELMVYLMEVLGIKDAIKLDGGGSFILHNGSFEKATNENRRINNIITWEG